MGSLSSWIYLKLLKSTSYTSMSQKVITKSHSYYETMSKESTEDVVVCCIIILHSI